jgi:hypothetical protein
MTKGTSIGRQEFTMTPAFLIVIKKRLLGRSLKQCHGHVMGLTIGADGHFTKGISLVRITPASCTHLSVDTKALFPSAGAMSRAPAAAACRAERVCQAAARKNLWTALILCA